MPLCVCVCVCVCVCERVCVFDQRGHLPNTGKKVLSQSDLYRSKKNRLSPFQNIAFYLCILPETFSPMSREAALTLRCLSPPDSPTILVLPTGYDCQLWCAAQ